MSMSLNEQLDAIFFFIKGKTEVNAHVTSEYIWIHYVELTPELGINRTLFNSIIETLVEDNYITPNNSGCYILTIKGRKFKGYVEDSQWYRWIIKNPIIQGVLATLIAGLITWVVLYLLGKG